MVSSSMICSVAGCAMHMKWPGGIGRGSWDWENPGQESANENTGIARTDLPYHWVSPCRLKRVGPTKIIVVVVVVVVVVVGVVVVVVAVVAVVVVVVVVAVAISLASLLSLCLNRSYY